MQLRRQGSAKLLRIGEILYVSLIVLSLYLLIVSRTGEAHTVWQVLHPAFIPVLFITTSILLAILLSSEATAYKMLLIIVHSILLHSLFSMIFPAGDLSGQQLVLGRTRRVFDDTILHGLSGWPTQTIQVFIVEMFNGINLQAALSTIFARILGIDIFYVHLSFIPVLWGTFVPVASFLITRAIGGSEKAAVISGLLVSSFPYTIYFGAISVPNSLGFIFFFYSVYFMLKYLSANDSTPIYLVIAFSLFSFLSHYLTGIMSFSLLILTVTFKAYENQKGSLHTDAKLPLTISFLVSASLLPLSFIYLRYFGTSSNPGFSLDKLYELPFKEIIGLLLIGDLTYSSDFRIIFLNVIGPLIALACMLYLLFRLKKDLNAKFRTQAFFLFAAFLIILIDYGVTKVFMEGLPLNTERLWVLRDFIATPFVALALYAFVSSLQARLKARTPKSLATADLRVLSRRRILRILTLVLVANVLTPLLIGGWTTLSLTAAYPEIAPLQTTSYELEAVKYIQANTHEKYVVIGDVWTIYAGEMIVGIENPRAYYYAPFNKTGYDLFANMRNDPSPQWMLLAMTYTDTTTAYFVIAKPRLGAEEFEDVVLHALQNGQLRTAGVFGEGKLYVFSYGNE